MIGTTLVFIVTLLTVTANAEHSPGFTGVFESKGGYTSWAPQRHGDRYLLTVGNDSWGAKAKFEHWFSIGHGYEYNLIASCSGQLQAVGKRWYGPFSMSGHNEVQCYYQYNVPNDTWTIILPSIFSSTRPRQEEVLLIFHRIGR
jgi:hypothetical protein